MYARTGYLGFVRRTELTQSDGGIVTICCLCFVAIVTNCYRYTVVIVTDCCHRTVANQVSLLSPNRVCVCVCVCMTERHDAIFVVGSLGETIMLRGMRYHPIDIENSVIRCHRKISEW